MGGDLEDEGSGWSGLFGDFDSGELDSSRRYCHKAQGIDRIGMSRSYMPGISRLPVHGP